MVAAGLLGPVAGQGVCSNVVHGGGDFGMALTLCVLVGLLAFVVGDGVGKHSSRAHIAETPVTRVVQPDELSPGLSRRRHVSTYMPVSGRRDVMVQGPVTYKWHWKAPRFAPLGEHDWGAR